ncbi:MAG: class I SAM-dependent methyltransferase, partial [Steroidobacteraceae bacterium]
MSATEKPVMETAAEDWSGEMGERWLKHLDRFEGMIAPVGRALMEHAAFGAGERVIDIGCGAGATSVEIGRRVGPRGAVLGLDISSQLVAAAEQRARAAGTGNVRFRCGDAASAALQEAPFDRLFSRFGVMFFPDPAAAFRQLRTFVRSGGRADFSVWAPARENAWVAQMMGVLGQLIELPAPVPRAPGPFALDDPQYVRELLEHAGFSAVKLETWHGEQPIGGPGARPADAVSFVLEAMSFGKVLDDAGPDVRAQAIARLTELFARHHGPQGILM